MRSIPLTLLAFTLIALPLDAQQRSATHQGFWIGLGLGGGSNLENAASGARGGGAAYLRLGGTVNQLLSIGADVTGWGRTVNGTTVTRTNATASVFFYPSLEGGLVLKSGLGFATATAATSGTVGNTTTTVTTTNTGFGATFGAGYEFQLGSNFYLTPGADFLVQIIDTPQGQRHTGTLLLITIGALWH